MKSEKLIIVFAKNLIEGTVKTRLAKSIGNFAALQVYKELLKVTEDASSHPEADTWVFYSKQIDAQQWPNAKKFVQTGDDLGQKMSSAFKEAFSAGYKSVVLIGSDLPDMNKKVISEAFLSLKTHDAVFGPAEDGGYYLVGLNAMIEDIFINKPWSQKSLLHETLQVLHSNRINSSTLEVLNDIDTIEDLKTSGFLEKRDKLAKTIALFND